MIGNAAHAFDAVALLPPASCANTAAATSSSWIAVAKYIGNLAFVQNVGVVTGGSITGKIQHADDNSGTNAADVAGAAFTAATDVGIQKIVVEANKLKPYVKYVGTIVTGPVVVGAVMFGHPQYVG